ncbi:MAG: hypothetical protein LLF89_02610 [Spirochaetaceae bacterium]|nr:hypothetical protein [Spirochaetaceae bacterium]
MRTLVGIDLGTTGVRSILYNENLDELGQDYNEYPLIFLPGNYIEQDADLWWTLVKKSIKAAIENSGYPAESVVGISISSQGISFLPVDRDCQPMSNAISWLDKRADGETAELLSRFSEEQIYKITGKRANGVYMFPKLLWLKNHQPRLFSDADHFLMPHDFIISKLCGNYVTDYTMASGTMLFDINKRCWSPAFLQFLGIDEAKLPIVAKAGSKAGVIFPEVAWELGINPNAAIVVGGQDQKCAAAGAGISDGVATISLGTAAAITRKWSQPKLDEKMRISCFADIEENRWVTEGVISTAAASLKWLRDTFFPGKSYGDLDLMAEGADAGSLFFYPHLSGASTPNWYADSCGCFYGLHLNTQPGAMVQALFEGVAFQVRENIEIMRGRGPAIQSLRIFGGGAKSMPWCNTIANVTNLPVDVLSTAETACLGAAMLAGIGSGLFSSLSEVQHLISIIGHCIPDSKAKVLYDNKYLEYIRIEKKLWA